MGGGERKGGERPARSMSAGRLIALERYNAVFSAFFTLVLGFHPDRCSHADHRAAPFLAFLPFFPSSRPPGYGLATPPVFPILIYLSKPDKHKHLHPESSSSGRLRCLDVFHFPVCPPPTSYSGSMLHHNLLSLVPARKNSFPSARR